MDPTLGLFGGSLECASHTRWEFRVSFSDVPLEDLGLECAPAYVLDFNGLEWANAHAQVVSIEQARYCCESQNSLLGLE